VTEQTALVVALLGDSVVEIRRCALYRIGVELPIAGAPPQTLVEAGRIHTSCYRHGHVTVHVTPVEQARPLARAIDVDPRWACYLGLSLALHAVLWAFVAVVPADDLGIGVAETVGPVTIARGELDGERYAGGGGGEGSDDEPDGTFTPLVLPSEGHGSQARRITREQAIEAALANPIIERGTATAIQALVGGADIADGVDGSKLYNGSAGTGFGTAVFGGAGGGSGTIVSGRYNTLVAGSGTGAGWALGVGVGHPRAREARAPTVVMCGRPGCALAIGDQDKAIIRRYIRRELPKIRYCYEKELLARPALIGDIATEFLIAPDGRVTGSHAEGFDATVASCVAEVIGNIQFPRAPRGGSTQVHYPFVFRPTG
jgi:hypothetical protein